MWKEVFTDFNLTPTQGVFRGDFQYSFPGVVRLFQGCNMYRCKEGINVDSYRTHKRSHTPSPRCDRAPGSHEWLWRHLHVVRSPGSCRHLREVKSGALESYDHCGHS